MKINININLINFTYNEDISYISDNCLCSRIFYINKYFRITDNFWFKDNTFYCFRYMKNDKISGIRIDIDEFDYYK